MPFFLFCLSSDSTHFLAFGLCCVSAPIGKLSGVLIERGLSWEEVKLASKQYTSGQRLVNARLDNGHQMQCYASTEDEGLQKIKELLKLSTAELLPNSVRDSGYVNPTAR